MCKIRRLVNMEMWTKNSEDISIFFDLFNEVCTKVTGKPGYKFNARALVCDEGWANFKAIKKIYGEEFVKDCIFGCQWHFSSDAQSKASKLSPDVCPKFLDICEKMMKYTTTVSKYNISKGMLNEMAKMHPVLKPWIAWWHARRSHIFAPFRIDGLPTVNLSEMGNTSWKRNVPGTMRLVTEAKKDVSTIMMQEKSLKLFNNIQMKSSGRDQASQSIRKLKKMWLMMLW